MYKRGITLRGQAPWSKETEEGIVWLPNLGELGKIKIILALFWTIKGEFTCERPFLQTQFFWILLKSGSDQIFAKCQGPTHCNLGK